MGKKRQVTAATRVLRQADVEYVELPYRYESGGGAEAGADQLGLDLNRVVKTLIVESDQREPACVLMHGDREVSLKNLARHIGARSMRMAERSTAERLSGYQVGGTSPFGLRTEMPIYIESTILLHDTIVINGGKRGFLIELATADLARVLDAEPVEVAI